MKRSREDYEFIRAESLHDLLTAIDVDTEMHFNDFIEVFRTPSGRLPKPIINLMIWRKKYPTEIYVATAETGELKLCIKPNSNCS